MAFSVSGWNSNVILLSLFAGLVAFDSGIQMAECFQCQSKDLICKKFFVSFCEKSKGEKIWTVNRDVLNDMELCVSEAILWIVWLI